MDRATPNGQVDDRRLPRWVAVSAAAVAPLLVAAVLSLLRNLLENTSAALILVLVIVMAACTGYRAAGLVAALSGGVWFDFFLTAPYHTLSVADSGDIETLMVLVLIGIAVNEIIAHARRTRAQLRDRDSYLAALLSVSGPVPTHLDDAVIVRDTVADHIRTMLDLDGCRWVDTVEAGVPTLDRDGEIRDRGRRLSVEADGWPTSTTVMLPLWPQHDSSPAFALTAASHIARPTLRQRQLAAALVDQLAGTAQHAETRTR